MKFGGLRRITTDMLRNNPGAVTGILDDAFARIENAFANLTPGDNFSGRVVTVTVRKGEPLAVQGTAVRAVTVRSFNAGTLTAPTFGWLATARGCDVLFDWNTGNTTAVVELFIEENT